MVRLQALLAASLIGVLGTAGAAQAVPAGPGGQSGAPQSAGRAWRPPAPPRPASHLAALGSGAPDDAVDVSGGGNGPVAAKTVPGSRLAPTWPGLLLPPARPARHIFGMAPRGNTTAAPPANGRLRGGGAAPARAGRDETGAPGGSGGPPGAPLPRTKAVPAGQGQRGLDG